MHFNSGIIVGIRPIQPQGTNSTMFTMCCGTAICDNERRCPSCKRFIIGFDAGSDSERGRIRWQNATKHWTR